MIFYYLDGTERCSDVKTNSLTINDEIQQRANSCQFSVFQGSKPTENQEVFIYRGAFVESQVTSTIVLQDSFETDVEWLRAGDTIFLDLDSALEKATVLSYTESTRTIVLTTAPSVSLNSGDKIGIRIFGGNVARVNDTNIRTLDFVQHTVTCIDFTKIFDKKIVADTWEDVDSRFIINSFVNTEAGSVNYKSTIDDLSYDDNSAIQAAWTEADDGDNPTVDDADFMEQTSSGVFPWTNSSGTALWTATPTTKDVSPFTGITSGTPTEGSLMLWIKAADYTVVTDIKVRIGSDASNYAELTFDVPSDNEWGYQHVNFTAASITGTPDWQNVDYAQIRITQTGDSSIQLNGLRVLHGSSFTLYNVSTTPVLDDIRSPQLKPTAFIQQLAKQWQYIWYIDYERDIHFTDAATKPAPFNVNSSTEKFNDLRTNIDTSQLGNRIIIRGGEKTSDSTYAQVIQGDNSSREWVLKNKFKNMVLTIDDNSSTDTMEAGTTTTNITATGHGLVTGDHIVNRTRTDSEGQPYVRQITKVDDDNFTVEAVPSQTTGDTFSKFDTAVTIGVEGLTDETTVDYVGNSNEKSVRATATTDTLDSTDYIRFEYNERIPIQVQYTDSASATALRALNLGDGIFDLDPYTDRNIVDTTTAVSIAEAKVAEFSNAIITGSFTTDFGGLESGMLINITDATRGISDDYVIQKVQTRQRDGEFGSYLVYSITFGTTLYGWIEFMQKLLRTQDSIELNTDDIVETFVASNEDVDVAETNTAQTGGIKTVSESEEVDVAETNNIYEHTPPWRWETSVGQPVATRWNLFSWS